MRSWIIRGALVVGTASMLVMPGGPADATVNDFEVVVQGAGTISPGLTAVVPQPQVWQLWASVTAVGIRNKGVVTVLGAGSCTASGSSTVRNPVNNAVLATVGETTGYGAGSGTWSCSSGPLVGKGGKLYYEREGSALEVELTDGNKPATGYGTLKCVFVPNTLQPTTSFQITCEGEYVDVK